MMAQLSLGIDISDDLVSGVAVAGNGRDVRVVSCASVLINNQNETGLAEALPLLLEQLQQNKKEHCDVGLSLSRLSLRNLSLPFTDKKKIKQVLPFELEEQLLFPIEQQIITTAPASLANSDDSATKLLTVAIEKSVLAQHIALFNERGIEPDRFCPADFVLTDRLRKAGEKKDNFFVLYCDISSITTVVVHEGVILFMRRISYPTEVFTNALFAFTGNKINIADPDEAERAVRVLCGSVRRGLDYFSLQQAINLRPDYVVLSGPMLLAQGFQEQIESELGLPGKKCDLIQSGDAVLSADVVKKWLPEIHDRPLALALQAGNRKKDVAFNFRREEFAPPSSLLRSKKQLTGAVLATGLLCALGLGYLFADYQSLQKKYDGLSAKMEQVFRKNFPGINPGRDPLMHMRSKLKEIDTVTVSMPIFTQEKRILVILSDISTRVPASIDLHTAQLIIDQNSVKIKGTTDAFNNVNTIKSLLSKSDRYSEVNIVSATKSKEKNTIRFEIRLQLATGENS